jgi:hypothetical protein
MSDAKAIGLKMAIKIVTNINKLFLEFMTPYIN